MDGAHSDVLLGPPILVLFKYADVYYELLVMVITCYRPYDFVRILRRYRPNRTPRYMADDSQSYEERSPPLATRCYRKDQRGNTHRRVGSLSFCRDAPTLPGVCDFHNDGAPQHTVSAHAPGSLYKIYSCRFLSRYKIICPVYKREYWYLSPDPTMKDLGYHVPSRAPIVTRRSFGAITQHQCDWGCT